MVLVQSCIDNIGLMKKAAFLFISLALVFPLGFWRGKNPADGGPEQEGSSEEGAGAWKTQSCCCRRWEAEGWLKCPLGGEGAPTPVTSSSVASRSFQSCPSPGKSLGACEGQRGKIGTRLFGGASFRTTRKRGLVIFLCSDGGGGRNSPPTSLLNSKYPQGLGVCTVASQMFFKVYN